MNLKAKGHLERQKQETAEKLAARIAALKEIGMDESAIQRNTLVKKMKAAIRKANFRLSAIAAQEKLNAQKIQAKADKLAAKEKEKTPEKPPQKAAKGAPSKKEKKDKKKAPPPAGNQE